MSNRDGTKKKPDELSQKELEQVAGGIGSITSGINAHADASTSILQAAIGTVTGLTGLLSSKAQDLQGLIAELHDYSEHAPHRAPNESGADYNKEMAAYRDRVQDYQDKVHEAQVEVQTVDAELRQAVGQMLPAAAAHANAELARSAEFAQKAAESALGTVAGLEKLYSSADPLAGDLKPEARQRTVLDGSGPQSGSV